MGLEPKIVHFRARQLPRPELPFLVTRLVDEVAEIVRDRLEIEYKVMRCNCKIRPARIILECILGIFGAMNLNKGVQK